MEGYPETEMCSHCGGECCRRQPGYCLPADFASTTAVRAAVESGKYTIVLLLDEHVMARVIRPQHRDTLRKEYCIFLQADGCELPFEDRPYGCRMLRPRQNDGGHCEPRGITIADAGKMWEESTYLPPLSTCTYMPPR